MEGTKREAVRAEVKKLLEVLTLVPWEKEDYHPVGSPAYERVVGWNTAVEELERQKAQLRKFYNV